MAPDVVGVDWEVATDERMSNVVQRGAAAATPEWAHSVHVEVAPVAPSPAHVWISGHWAWHRNHYVWVPGYWEVPASPGYVWVPGHWAPRGPGFVWIEGRWRAR